MKSQINYCSITSSVIDFAFPILLTITLRETKGPIRQLPRRITSNDRPFGCPIIYMDMNSQLFVIDALTMFNITLLILLLRRHV